MRGVIIFAGLALAAAAVVPRHLAQTSGEPLPAAVATRPAAAPPPAVVAGATISGAVEIPRDDRGHFQVDGRVDGRRIRFMVDTGATVIALTAADAATLGIHPARGDFVVVVQTANGTARAAPVRLDMVEIGGVVVREVAAVVMPDQALGENLLGMSFLSRLRHFEYGEGKLTLEQ